MRSLYLMIVLAALFSATATQGADEAASAVADLLSKAPLTRQAAFDRILGERTRMIKDLVAILQKPDIDTSFNGPRHRAVVLLGQIRATEAVEPLAKCLMYVPEGFMVYEAIPREAYHVCAVALRDIGEPSVPAMLKVIAGSSNQEERDIAAWVVMEVEGKSQARCRFEGLAKMAKDDTSRARYKSAGDYIQSYKPDFDPPGVGLPPAREQPGSNRKPG